jgi:hypothetical protein
MSDNSKEENANKQHDDDARPFLTEAPIDISAFLLKESIFQSFGRFEESRLILYTLINRLLLLFQEPIAIVIFNVPKTGEPYIAFKSLNSKPQETRQGEVYPVFGDPELAERFDRQWPDLKHQLNIEKKDPNKNTFRIYKTTYEIAFFRIDYHHSGSMEKANFIHIGKDNNLYGLALRDLLEDYENKNSEIGRVFPISDIFGKEYKSHIQVSLDKEFSAFLNIKSINDLVKSKEFSELFGEYNPEKRDEKKAEDKKLIEPILQAISDDIYKLKIATAPFFKVDGAFPNFFLFLKTATRHPTRFRWNGMFPYDLRLLLGEDQQKDIKNHYDGLKKKLDGNELSCRWRSEAGQCLIGMYTEDDQINNVGKQIGACLLNTLSSDDIIREAQEPLHKDERSFIDTALSSGLLGFTSAYPTWSRDKVSDHIDQTVVWNENQDKSWRITRRLAATLCITHQLIDPQTPSQRRRAFVSPLHVAGVTSMAALMLMPAGSDRLKNWMQIYSVFLSVISRTVNRRVRVPMKALYLDALRKVFAQTICAKFEFTSGFNGGFYIHSFIKEMNLQSNRLSSVYPFNIVEMSLSDEELKNKQKPRTVDKKSEGVKKIKIFDDHPIYFCITKESLYQSLYEYDFIDISDIDKQFNDGYQDAVTAIRNKKVLDNFEAFLNQHVV